MAKAEDAFRTIGEVSDWLETPAHVLRFWESKFSQITPVKRAGGRRYYRPEDVELLGGIKFLLHEEGMTIKGVQKVLREQGIRHVAALSPRGAIGATGAAAADAPETDGDSDGGPVAEHVPETASETVSEPAPTAEAEPAPAPRSAPPAPRRAGTFARIMRADPALVRRRKKRIAPLLARMRALRERMTAE